MKINNRLTQYAAGVFFLLACAFAWLMPTPANSDPQSSPSRLKVSTVSTNESTETGYQIRKLSLEITLFSSPY